MGAIFMPFTPSLMPSGIRCNNVTNGTLNRNICCSDFKGKKEILFGSLFRMFTFKVLENKKDSLAFL